MSREGTTSKGNIIAHDCMYEVCGASLSDAKAEIERLGGLYENKKLKETKQAVEVRFDENGKVLFCGPWMFSGIHKPGEQYIENYKSYSVLASAATFGKYGGTLVEHVVRPFAGKGET